MQEKQGRVTFKAGDRVRVNANTDDWASGLEGRVVSADDSSSGAKLVLVDFGSAAKNRGHLGTGRYGSGSLWFILDYSLTHVTPPSIASDLRLTPQAKTVLAHIKRNKSISPAEALIVHGISRLASCIHEIRRRAGYRVDCEMRQDDQGHKYASYSLASSTVH